MFVPKDIIQNLLMAIPPVRDFAMRWHHTGIGSNAKLVRETFEAYASYAPVQGQRILELGPGQTIEMLALARQHGAARCSAADIAGYCDPARAAELGIDYRVYSGHRLPFDDASFDIVWAWDVLEHVRRPAETLCEIHRVLAVGGRLVCRVDLRDHAYLADESHWLECLRYPRLLWNAMTWFRSSHVNRLRLSEWDELLRKAGFKTVQLRPLVSEKLAQLRHQSDYLQRYSATDVATWRFEAVCSA